jgi:3-oxoacyl-[acyl-carrier protein] reductase
MAILDQKTALVTGASRGIGKAIALTLAEAGADLAVTARSEAALADTVAAVTAAGRRAIPLAVDLADAAGIAAAVDKAAAELGRIDILVNNAGLTSDGLLMRMSEEQWDRVVDANLKGSFLFTKAATRLMMKQRCGSVVNVTSVVGITGNAGQSNYAASKAGLIGFSKSVARELAGRNVRVNCVAPGFIDTQMTEGLPEATRAKYLEAIPLGRFGSPKDVADAVLYLASDASSYVTGQVIVVSGGMAM